MCFIIGSLSHYLTVIKTTWLAFIVQLWLVIGSNQRAVCQRNKRGCQLSRLPSWLVQKTIATNCKMKSAANMSSLYSNCQRSNEGLWKAKFQSRTSSFDWEISLFCWRCCGRCLLVKLRKTGAKQNRIWSNGEGEDRVKVGYNFRWLHPNTGYLSLCVSAEFSPIE